VCDCLKCASRNLSVAYRSVGLGTVQSLLTLIWIKFRGEPAVSVL
jgi:hypothetical protein